MTEVALRRASVQLGARRVLDAVDVTARSGELVAIAGPNGAGKTTLLRALLGLVPLAAGEARIDGVEVRTLSPLARARLAAYLPQARPLAWPLKVTDIVALGRFAYGAAPGRLGGADAEAVARALAACDLDALAMRDSDTLSGGELARVHLARALASEASILAADEPTAALDLRHAYETMTRIQRFTQGGGLALVVLHDLSLAVRFASRLVVMDAGRIVADGPPEHILTPALLARVFGVAAAMTPSADGPSLTITGTLADHTPGTDSPRG